MANLPILARLFLFFQLVASPIIATWDANPADQQIAGYRVLIDQTIYDVGTVTLFTTALPAGAHQASVSAYNLAGIASAFSSPPVGFAVAATIDPACTNLPLTLIVDSYTQTVEIGSEGTVHVHTVGPAAVTNLEVRLGTQIVGAIPAWISGLFARSGSACRA